MPDVTPEPEVGLPDNAGWYSYAILRVVPRIERGEQINVGVILFARTLGFLEARLAFDESRLAAIAPELDLIEVKRRLEEIPAVCAGFPEAGPIARSSPSERFHWLTSPRSTVIQTSPIHVGYTTDPSAALEKMLDQFVRPVRPG